MEGLQALEKIKQLIPDRELTYIEETIFLGTWEGQRYRDMALELGYEEGYIKDTGARLWRLLSDCLGQEVTKKRVRFLFNQGPTPETVASPPVRPLEDGFNQPNFPGSPLPFGSPLYVVRSPLEELCMSGLQQSGSLIRIKAPWRMGKTSLMNHAMGTAQRLGMKTVFVDVRQADADALDNIDGFLRWFCCAISHQLGITCDFDTHWFASAGSKLSCTALVQEWLMHQVNVPLVVALDTVHHLLDYPHIASHFFSMLRSWYEKARVRDEWQNLRLMMAYVNDLGLPLQSHQSPFNVGLLLEIPPFTREQVVNLANRDIFHCIELNDLAKLKPLFTLIKGQPYLWQLALYWLRSGHLAWAQLLEQAPTNQGIYREYLRYVGMKLQRDPALVQAVRHMLTAAEPVVLEQGTLDPLNELGLIRLNGPKASLSCELFRQYFATYLADQHG
jgi:hypothetical protein